MAIKISNYDVAEYLDNEEMISAYLQASLETGDIQDFKAAINNVARENRYITM